jgi:hypothetical protein
MRSLLFWLISAIVPFANAKCAGLMTAIAGEAKAIYFFEGQPAVELTYGKGVAASGRMIFRRTTPDGNRIYRIFHEIEYSSEEEAKAALDHDPQLQKWDEKFRMAADYGAPKYYGLQLIQTGDKTWTYFGVLEDLAPSGDHFSSKGLSHSEVNKDKATLKKAGQMLQANPTSVQKLARDLVSDVSNRVSRGDPDFIIRADGCFWLDPENWEFNQSLEKCINRAADSVDLFFNQIAAIDTKKVALNNFTETVIEETKKLEASERAKFIHELVGMIRLSIRVRKFAGKPASLNNSAEQFAQQLEALLPPP